MITNGSIPRTHNRRYELGPFPYVSTFTVVFNPSFSHEDGETDTASENDDIEESSNQQIMSHQTEHQLVLSRPGSVNSVTESGGQQAQHKFRKGEVLTAVSG